MLFFVINPYHWCQISNTDVFRFLCADTTKEPHSVFQHGKTLSSILDWQQLVSCSTLVQEMNPSVGLFCSMTINLLISLLAINGIICLNKGPHSLKSQLFIQLLIFQVHIKKSEFGSGGLRPFAVLSAAWIRQVHFHRWLWMSALCPGAQMDGRVSFCLTWTQWGNRTPDCGTHWIDS